MFEGLLWFRWLRPPYFILFFLWKILFFCWPAFIFSDVNSSFKNLILAKVGLSFRVLCVRLTYLDRSVMHSWHLLLPLTILVSNYFPLSNSGSKYAGYMNAVHICSTVSSLYMLTATLGAIIDLKIVKLPLLLATLRLSLGMRRRNKN